MKLWFVIYVGTQIGGSAGPLPYDEAECLARAAEKNAEWQQKISTGVDLHGNPVSDIARSMHFKCEWHDVRPQITYIEKDARRSRVRNPPSSRKARVGSRHRGAAAV